jgi:hypothetical protein
MRNTNRALSICAVGSAVIPAMLLLLSALTRDVNGWKGGLPLTPHFHVGVFDGGLWFHSHGLPYSGGTIAIAREGFPSPRTTDFDFPGVYYRFIRLPLHPEPFWTLRLSLAYPLVLSLVLPLIWTIRFRRAAHNERSGVDAGRPLRFHFWRRPPGATHRDCSADSP